MSDLRDDESPDEVWGNSEFPDSPDDPNNRNSDSYWLQFDGTGTDPAGICGKDDDNWYPKKDYNANYLGGCQTGEIGNTRWYLKKIAKPKKELKEQY